MHTRPFGRGGWTGSEVGYGLWGVGGWTGSDDDESIQAIERSIALGCTFFDTALAYGDGKSEELLGRVLARHHDKRLVVATKIPPKSRQWPARPEYTLDDVFPPDYIREATETSLKNLGAMARARWPIEQQYRELKDELGLDHCEDRSHRGWAHHVVLTALAFTFLQH